jgi:hypothetical protein
MPYLTTNYQIAAGNDNAGGLALVTTLVDGNGVYFQDINNGIEEQSRGLRVYRPNRTVGRQGCNWVHWLSPVLLAQYEYLKDNYEGLVTIKTAFHSETFANYNATLTLPDFHELDWVIFNGAWNDPTFTGLGCWLIWWHTGVEAL